MASAESHMWVSVASSVCSTTVSQNAPPLCVLLAFHLDPQQTLEHRIAGLALAVSPHRFNERPRTAGLYVMRRVRG
jgi:hypothetical protein